MAAVVFASSKVGPSLISCGSSAEQIRCAQDHAQLIERRRFEFCAGSSWQTRDARVFLGVAPECRRSPVVAEHDALERIGNLRPRRIAPRSAIRFRNRVDAVPQFAVDDGWMHGLTPPSRHSVSVP